MPYKIAFLYFICILYLGLSIVVYMKGRNRHVSKSFILFASTLIAWSFGLAQYFSSQDLSESLFWINFIYVSGSSIAATFLLFSFSYYNPQFKYLSSLTIFILGPALVVGILAFTTKGIVKDVVLMNGAKIFIHGNLRLIWEIQFNISLIYAFYRFFKLYSQSKGLQRTQCLYITIGNLSINVLSGFTNVYLVWFGIQKYIWLGPPMTLIWFLIFCYAIYKYRLMDVTLAFTSAGIFIVVYALVLGLPFGLAIFGRNWLTGFFADNWFWAPMVILLTLATAGPFIFLYLKRKAESQLLQEERRIEHQLSQASYGMNRVHELNRLSKLIIKLVVKLLRVKSAALYLLNFEKNKYELREPISERSPNSFIESENVLVQYLLETKFPLVIEEIHMHSLIKNKNVSSKEIEVQMRRLSAHVIVPIAVDNTLLGFLTLGERKEKKIYRQELLNTLSILGNQAALVIENCQFMEAEKERLKKEGAQARRESLDMMVGTMAHEIDNPLAFVIGEAEYLEFLIKSDQYQLPPEFLAAITKSCSQIISGSWRVSKIIKAVEDYSKAESGQNKAVYIHNVMIPLRSLLLLLGKNYPGIPLTEEIEPELPPMWAEEVTIEEIIYNYVENSYHAVRRLPRGQPWVKLRIYRKEDMIVIEVSDNGYGIEARILKQLFQVPTTTKGSAEGTGLGLYRARQIVDKLKGRAWAESEGRDKGSKFFAEIPIFKGDPALLNKVTSRRAF